MGNASGAAGQVTKQIVQLPPNTEAKPSLLMNTLTSPPTTPSNANKATPANAAKGSPEKFELTQDYIQQTIQQALKKDNLSPEIEQKLLALQQQNISDKSVVIRKNAQKMIDPATGEPMDDEWEGASTAERSIANKNKRKKLEENVIAERQASKRTPSSAALARSGKRSATPTSNGPSYIESNERMERQKLQQALLRHKEQLKRDITKKRSMQEKELQTEIQKQIEAIKGKPSSNMVKLTASAPTPPAAATAPQEIASAAPPPASTEVKVNLSPVAPEPNNSDIMAELQDQDKLVGNKRKRHESDENNESNTNSNLTENNFAHPPKPKKKRRSSGQNPSVKKDKLYCICKTRYDPKKFYVGCDVCSNWFHGSCVGITEGMAKTMSEYICDECRNARENREIYCICQQPYDETQFYIGCEKCSDWFHGRCVGILQSEANHIDEYLCPNCAPNSKLNQPNQKRLTADDFEVIRKLLKALSTHRSSQPFQQPVNPNEALNYYKVVKEPMDLATVEKKVNQGEYQKLCEFIGDVMRIFENCRFFNQPSSSIMKNADSLEAFFSQKLSHLREKVGQQASTSPEGIENNII